MPYPFDCLNINPNDMIDLDEAGIYPNKTNHKCGKATSGNRVREVGTYVKDRELNILMANSGDNNAPDRWIDM